MRKLRKTTWKRIEQLKSLSFSDWRILLSSSFFLPAVALSLRLYGLNRTQTFLNWYGPLKFPGPEPGLMELQEAIRIARLVNICARHGLYRTNCLKQVLVLHLFLNKKGIPSTFHIGVSKNQEQALDAHAWLECANTPLIDSNDSLQKFSSIHSQGRHTGPQKKL